jgi:hypothetical protein
METKTNISRSPESLIEEANELAAFAAGDIGAGMMKMRSAGGLLNQVKPAIPPRQWLEWLDGHWNHGAVWRTGA